MRIKIKVSPYFDVIDDKYVEAILKSSTELLNKYIPSYKKGHKYDLISTVSNEMLSRFWPYLDNMDFAQLEVKKIKIHILPLNRVGAIEGASGSRVFVTYFSLSDNILNRYSNPLVLKFLDLSISGRDKLDEEKKQAEAIRPFVVDRYDYFAFPIKYDKQGDISLLWALFSSAVMSEEDRNNGKKPVLKENNLWKYLSELDLNCSSSAINSTISRSIDSLYDILRPVHTKGDGRRFINKNICDEYNWYLRNEKWKDTYFQTWGDGSQKECFDFGQQWINPNYVYERLKGYNTNITIGAIHGDLHTKNIVYAHNDNVKIIDFGWTNIESHLAKDFILLESNIRFMVLHPDVPYTDLLLLCETLDKNVDPANFRCDYSRFIHSLIVKIRNHASKVLDLSRMHDEYLIPLFLMCLGLLIFNKSFDNIISSRLTVLHLAKNVDNYLNGVLDERKN